MSHQPGHENPGPFLKNYRLTGDGRRRRQHCLAAPGAPSAAHCLAVSGCWAMHQQLKIKAKSLAIPVGSHKNWRRKDVMPKLERNSLPPQDPIHQEKGRSRLAGYKPVRTLLMPFFPLLLHVHFLDHHCSQHRKNSPPLGCRGLVVRVAQCTLLRWDYEK